MGWADDSDRDAHGRPRWRDADDDGDEPREWEIEAEEEKSDREPVLGGTAPVAKLVFLGIVIVVALGGVLTLIRGLAAWAGR